jgi:predicted ATPase
LSYLHQTDEFEKGFTLRLNLYCRSKDSKITISEEALSVWILINDNPFYSYKYHDRKIGSGVVSVYNEMSDGTVRMLCWAAILLSPTLPSLLVIDEPELGIHAAWMPVLANWIKDASQKTQLIVSTHSPDLLSYIDSKTVKSKCANFKQLFIFFEKLCSQ